MSDVTLKARRPSARPVWEEKPTVVGQGKRLFHDVARPSGFDVTDVRVAGSGAVAMTLTPAPFRTATYVVVDGKEVQVEE